MKNQDFLMLLCVNPILKRNYMRGQGGSLGFAMAGSFDFAQLDEISRIVIPSGVEEHQQKNSLTPQLYLLSI